MRQISSHIRPDRVALYIRWSTEDQGEGTTLEVQLGACSAFAASQGWTVTPTLIFVDDGISGATLNRPALTRLRTLVDSGAVDCVVVYKIDRLSRSVVDMVRLVLDEWDGRCRLKSACEPIDTATQTGRLFFYQLMSFAEWERSVIRERTFAGKLRRAQEGKNPGISPAYGYRLGQNGMPVVEPAEAALVRLIFRLYQSGLGCRSIARQLAQLGHPSPAGREWSGSQIARMLSNPIYMGTLVYGKQVTRNGNKRRSDTPLVVRENTVPPIVATADYAAVQALKLGRPGVGPRSVPGTGRTTGSSSLLTGLARCRCSRPFGGSSGSGSRACYRYYACPSPRCEGGRIPQATLDEAVAAALLIHVQPADRSLEQRVAGALAAELAEAQEHQAGAERDLARAGRAADRLGSLLLAGEITAADYRTLKGEADGRAVELRNRVELCRGRTDQLRTALAEATRRLEQFGLPERWAVLAVPEQKRVLNCFVQEVQAFLDRQAGHVECVVTWRFSPPPEPAC